MYYDYIKYLRMTICIVCDYDPFSDDLDLILGKCEFKCVPCLFNRVPSVAYIFLPFLS